MILLSTLYFLIKTHQFGAIFRRRLAVSVPPWWDMCLGGMGGAMAPGVSWRWGGGWRVFSALEGDEKRGGDISPSAAQCLFVHYTALFFFFFMRVAYAEIGLCWVNSVFGGGYCEVNHGLWNLHRRVSSRGKFITLSSSCYFMLTLHP